MHLIIYRQDYHINNVDINYFCITLIGILIILSKHCTDYLNCPVQLRVQRRIQQVDFMESDVDVMCVYISLYKFPLYQIWKYNRKKNSQGKEERVQVEKVGPLSCVEKQQTTLETNTYENGPLYESNISEDFEHNNSNSNKTEGTSVYKESHYFYI